MNFFVPNKIAIPKTSTSTTQQTVSTTTTTSKNPITPPVVATKTPVNAAISSLFQNTKKPIPNPSIGQPFHNTISNPVVSLSITPTTATKSISTIQVQSTKTKLNIVKKPILSVDSSKVEKKEVKKRKEVDKKSDSEKSSKKSKKEPTTEKPKKNTKQSNNDNDDDDNDSTSKQSAQPAAPKKKKTAKEIAQDLADALQITVSKICPIDIEREIPQVHHITKHTTVGEFKQMITRQGNRNCSTISRID